MTALVAIVIVALALPSTGAFAGSPNSSGPQGNVTPSTQPQQGVGVVATSAPVDGRVALLLRNGTTKHARIERITATAMRSDGGLVTAARSEVSYPQVLAPGELGLASVQFGKNEVSLDPAIRVKVRTAKTSSARAARALTVGNLVLSRSQTGSVAQTIGATVTNPTRSWTARNPKVAVMCFGEASLPTTFTSIRLDTRRIKPGKSVPVTVPLTSLCPTYLVAARAT